jgi:hypothetical protein
VVRPLLPKAPRSFPAFGDSSRKARNAISGVQEIPIRPNYFAEITSLSQRVNQPAPNIPLACGSKLLQVRVTACCRTPSVNVSNGETAVEDTAPSKRLLRLYPRYRKTSDGPLAIAEIGIDAIRKDCPHADAWLTAVNTGLTRQR